MFNYLEEDIQDLLKNDKYNEIVVITKKNFEQNLDMNITALKNNHFILAKAYYSLAKNKQAFEHITKVMEILVKHDFPSNEIVDAKIEYAKILRRMARSDLAMEIYSDILRTHENSLNNQNKAVIYHNLANLHLERGNFEQSRELYHIVLDLDRNNENEEGQAYTLSSLGGLYFYLGEYEKSINFYHQSLILRKKMKDALGEATVSLNLGSVYANQLEQSLANEFLNIAEILFKEMKHDRGVQNVLYTKARLNFNLKNYNQVIENLKIFNKKTETEITRNDISMILILAESLQKEKLIEESRIVIELGLAALQYLSGGNHEEMIQEFGKLKQLLSQVAVNQNKFDEAMEILDELEKVTDKIKDKQSLIAIYHAKSQIHLSLGEFEHALTFAGKGKEIAVKFKDSSLVNLLELLFEINFALGEFSQCIKILKDISGTVQITNKMKYDVILRTFKLLDNIKIKEDNRLLSTLFELTPAERSLYLGQQVLGKVLKLNSITKQVDILKQMNERIQRDMEIINSENDGQPPFETKTIAFLQDEENIKELSIAEVLGLLDQFFFSFINNYISDKYLVEIDWSKTFSEETKPIIQLKQAILKELLNENFNLENTQTGNHSIDNKFKQMFTKFNSLTLEYQDKITRENKLMLLGLIFSVIINTLYVMYFSDLDEREKKDD